MTARLLCTPGTVSQFVLGRLGVLLSAKPVAEVGQPIASELSGCWLMLKTGAPGGLGMHGDIVEITLLTVANAEHATGTGPG